MWMKFHGWSEGPLRFCAWNPRYFHLGRLCSARRFAAVLSSALHCAWCQSAGAFKDRLDRICAFASQGLGINEFGMSSGEKVRASHLLVKHQGSRRPASWKDPDGKVIRKTSRDDAVAKLRDFKSQIESGQATLADLAKNDSDCSSAKRGGDLG